MKHNLFNEKTMLNKLLSYLAGVLSVAIIIWFIIRKIGISVLKNIFYDVKNLAIIQDNWNYVIVFSLFIIFVLFRYFNSSTGKKHRAILQNSILIIFILLFFNANKNFFLPNLFKPSQKKVEKEEIILIPDNIIQDTISYKPNFTRKYFKKNYKLTTQIQTINKIEKKKEEQFGKHIIGNYGIDLYYVNTPELKKKYYNLKNIPFNKKYKYIKNNFQYQKTAIYFYKTYKK